MTTPTARERAKRFVHDHLLQDDLMLIDAVTAEIETAIQAERECIERSVEQVKNDGPSPSDQNVVWKQACNRVLAAIKERDDG